LEKKKGGRVGLREKGRRGNTGGQRAKTRWKELTPIRGRGDTPSKQKFPRVKGHKGGRECRRK